LQAAKSIISNIIRGLNLKKLQYYHWLVGGFENGKCFQTEHTCRHCRTDQGQQRISPSVKLFSHIFNGTVRSKTCGS